jgi:3-oxoacyl-[acyl-carrier-protein] synthase II
VTPLGTGIQKTWDALLRGASGIGKIEQFDARAYPCQIAGEVKDFNPLDYMDKKEVKRTDRFAQFAIASATMAIEAARIAITEEQAHRMGCLLGVGLGGLATLEHTHANLLRAGPDRVSPFLFRC